MTPLVRRLAHSKLAHIVAKAGFTLLILWLVCRNVDFVRLDDIMRHQDHALLLCAALLMSFQIVLGMFRWRLILVALAEGRHVLSRMEAMKIYYISVFFNGCLPGTVGGDVVRVWLTKSDHVPLSLAIHSVIIDRIITLAALFVLIMLTLPMLSAIAGFDARPVALAMVLAMIAGLWLLFNIKRLLGKFPALSQSSWRPVHWLLYFVDSLHMLQVHRMASALSMAYGIASNAVWCLCGCVVAKSLGIPMTALQSITLIPPVMLAAVLPVSIGGWGLREAGMIVMLGLIGIGQTAALTLSVQMALLSMLVVLPAGLLWLARRKPRRVIEAEAMAAMTDK